MGRVTLNSLKFVFRLIDTINNICISHNFEPCSRRVVSAVGFFFVFLRNIIIMNTYLFSSIYACRVKAKGDSHGHGWMPTTERHGRLGNSWNMDEFLYYLLSFLN